jgi:lactose/L-arabinose transport system permease protein
MTTSEQSAGIVRAPAVTSAMSPHIIFRSIRRALLYIALSIAAFISIFPFYWMVVGSTNTSPDIAHGKASPGTHLFQNIRGTSTVAENVARFWNR